MPNSENIQKKLIIDTLIVSGIIFLLSCIFFFFDLKQIPLGFLLGVIISIINHLILCLQTNLLLNPKLGVGAVPLTSLCYITRFALYGGALFLAFYLEHLNYNYLAWYSVFVGFLIIKIVIIVKYGKYRDKSLLKNDQK